MKSSTMKNITNVELSILSHNCIYFNTLFPATVVSYQGCIISWSKTLYTKRKKQISLVINYRFHR